MSPRLAYICFDVVPAPKGAAIHIAAFARALAREFGQLDLVTVAPPSPNPAKVDPHIRHHPLPALGATPIDRILHFQSQLGQWWPHTPFHIVQVRSIFEGFPIALQKQHLCDCLVFEVNGLPSIELKYRYPAVAEDRVLLNKLRYQEDICLQAADLIVTPSPITRNYLTLRGVPFNTIRVIPNGVDLDRFSMRSPKPLSETFRLLYFGVLTAWQGVPQALEAIALANRDFPAELEIIGPSRPHQLTQIWRLAAKLNIRDRLTVLPPLSQHQLLQRIHQADAVVAPLTPNDRNLEQGCCPLKVLEGMASGTPVIASDLACVRALGQNGEQLLLVKPGSAKAIKDAILQLRDRPQLGIRIAANARQQVERHFRWEVAAAALISTYRELMPSLSKTA